MRLNDTIDLYAIEKVSDGRGGFKKLEQYKYSTDCRIKQTRLDKQEKLYGEVSIKAISITVFEPIDTNLIIIYKDTKYKIFNETIAFNKYSYDLTEIKND